MSIFCLLFPVYVVCNDMRNVLQSIRMALFHIMKWNAPITWYLVWHEGMRVFRGCKAWWSIMLEDDVQQKELSLVTSCPCCLLGTVSGISYVLTSAWCCLRGYPLERKMVAEAEQKTPVGFTHYAGEAELPSSPSSAIAPSRESEENYPGVSCSSMGYVITSSWEYWRYTLDWEHSSTLLVLCLSDLAPDLLVRSCVPCSSVSTQKALNQFLEAWCKSKEAWPMGQHVRDNFMKYFRKLLICFQKLAEEKSP